MIVSGLSRHANERRKNAVTIAERLLPEFEGEMKKTRKMLELVPEGKMDFKPHAKSMPLGKLAGHVAELPSWGKSTFSLTVLEMGPDYKPFDPQTPAEILAEFEKHVPEAREWLTKATDEDMDVNWQFQWGGQTIISQPRYEVYREWVIDHLVHHRAQLGVYLRLLDIKIPGCYGPSADEV
jgi:uncharacterized damage-inducible protein DinB